MIGRKSRFLTVVLAGLLAFTTGFAGAQSTPPPDGSSEAGEENEFGIISMPYQTEMDGRELRVEARIVLKEHYTDQSTTFFMFAVTTETAPAMYASINSVRTADGEELKLDDKKTGSEVEQWFVDIEDMPPVGTELIIDFNVGSTQKGYYHVGAMVVPFTYRWEQITMDDGDQAKLYGFTQVGVNEASSDGGGFSFRAPWSGDGGGRFVPAPGLLVALVGVGLTAAVYGNRRRIR